MFRRKIVLEEEIAVFVLVNFADVVLTAICLSPQFRGSEVNPFVGWIIGAFPNAWMVVLPFYKFALVTFVVLVCQLIHPSHPKIARGILIYGSIAYGILMVYTVVMLFAYAFHSL